MAIIGPALSAGRRLVKSAAYSDDAVAPASFVAGHAKIVLTADREKNDVALVRCAARSAGAESADRLARTCRCRFQTRRDRAGNSTCGDSSGSEHRRDIQQYAPRSACT